ncbi:UDP-GlcNAc:betaGal beta-1,3-N-acetylglucosaminyltransferase-like protein 1 isoform X7 [Homo sapiens]|uniref:UDP-GlcNAc:betaGal beta-1,3-N-acetylglucosaminyltransferase-like protein 1 isoform X7 n=1 Tax=Homo sapiens TaxID=9606 RepID=UPI0023DE6DC2|nr:UDP-GlcNAc:betaGal beta-1,3-N-acetylglucosaminyltransferase-like protein 1 isoform X7 [Homo sapiens]
MHHHTRSIILPVHNAEPWLDECLRSVLQQDFEGTMELSVFNDASKDKSGAIIEKWRVKLEDSGVHVIIGGHDSPSPRGVGYAKNQAVAQSSGSYLCFLDSDDVMMPQRVRLQHEAAVQHPSSFFVACVQTSWETYGYEEFVACVQTSWETYGYEEFVACVQTSWETYGYEEFVACVQTSWDTYGYEEFVACVQTSWDTYGYQEFVACVQTSWDSPQECGENAHGQFVLIVIRQA